MIKKKIENDSEN